MLAPDGVRVTLVQGVDGFIVVDMPPEEADELLSECNAEGLSFIPLAAPTSTSERLAKLGNVASSFIYCVSVTGTGVGASLQADAAGVTGSRTSLDSNLGGFISRIRSCAAHNGMP